MVQHFRRSRWILAASVFVAMPRMAGAADGTTPTFSKDIAPIFYKSCVNCHRAGEATPFALTSYDTARPWARAIKKKVVAREMPPWFADPQYGHFSNDPRLSQKDIDAITAWVDGGAPKGLEKDLPPVPQFATGWLHPDGSAPDAIIEMPIEFRAPGSGEIPMTTFYTPIPFAQDKFIEATQAKPTNRAFVHHSVIHSRTLPAGSKVDKETGLLVNAKTGRPFAEQVRESGVNEEPSRDEAADRARAASRAQDVFASNEVWVATYAPGWLFEKYKPGIGKRVGSGAEGWHISFNMHYQPTGKPETDRTQLALWYQKVPLEKELVVASQAGETHIVEGKQILNQANGRHVIPNIPAYAENWSIAAITPVYEPIAIYQFNPHMHLRGHDMKYTVVYPDGREETLFSVPKYDFNWQVSYENAQPVRVPAGSKIIVSGHMDNSIKNKFNPGPDKEVFWSEQSWDEMFLGFMTFTKDASAAKPAPAVQH